MSNHNHNSSLCALLQEHFVAAHESPLSHFYKTFYAEQKFTVPEPFPKSINEWRTLPLLTKERLVREPFFDRLFVPFEQAHSIRTSSGTSGRGIVLIPRNFHVDRSYFKDKFTKMLCFYFPHFGMDEACEPFGLGHLGALPNDLPTTARMAKQFGIDAIAGAISPILTAVPHFKEAGLDLAAIRYLHLWGERPSKVQFDETDHVFPNAEITWEYSNIEAGGQSARACPGLAALRDDRVHPLTDRYFWELIDPNTGTVIDELEREGEIVLTTLWHGNAIPVMRYRTGDLAVRVEKTCDCSATEVYQILGRVQYDRAVIPGGELKSSELERVLEPYAQALDNNFELHLFEKNGSPPRLVLYVSRKKEGVPSEHELRSHVLTAMRVGAQHTLMQLLNERRIAELTIEPLVPHDKKTRRIVRHYS